LKIKNTTSLDASGEESMKRLPASATATDHNRLFTAVMTAKAAGKTMVIFHDSASCVISSFGVQ
jgi:hypothetical protein